MGSLNGYQKGVELEGLGVGFGGRRMEAAVMSSHFLILDFGKRVMRVGSWEGCWCLKRKGLERFCRLGGRNEMDGGDCVGVADDFDTCGRCWGYLGWQGSTYDHRPFLVHSLSFSIGANVRKKHTIFQNLLYELFKLPLYFGPPLGLPLWIMKKEIYSQVLSFFIGIDLNLSLFTVRFHYNKFVSFI